MTEPRVAIVTPAQRAVIGQLTTDGPTDRQIAARLGISPHTAKCHMRDALKACGCPTRTQLVVELLRGRLKLRTEYNRGGPNAQAVDNPADT